MSTGLDLTTGPVVLGVHVWAAKMGVNSVTTKVCGEVTAF